jgi:hypothetical protein
MPDSMETAPTEARAEPDETAAQIGRSLSSIWERRDGARPNEVATELDGDVVRCVIEAAPRETERPPEDGAPFVNSIETTSYRNEAIASVERVTRRSVKALIAKPVAKTDNWTNTFILAPRGRKN